MPIPNPSFSSPSLILASASPRRRELLALLGLPFTVRVSPFEEPLPPAETVPLADYVCDLAVEKARAVAREAAPDSLILGADTLVTLALNGQGVPLGKPIDAEDARRMLRLLAGQTHVVFTGVALFRTDAQGGISEPYRAVSQTHVRFRPLTEAMIEGYLATGEPFDKAGAYGAQGYAAPFIEAIEGDYFTVVGLPLCVVGQLLERAGVVWWDFRSEMPPIVG